MLSVPIAIRFAETHAGNDSTREGLRPVRVEPKRVWATDGHRAILLDVEATPDQVGDYVDGQKIQTIPGPPIDQVIPKADPPIAVQLGKKTIADLQALAWMLNQWTIAYVSFPSKGAASINFSRSNDERAERVTVLLEEGPISRVKKGTRLNVEYLLEAIEAVHAGDEVTLYQASDMDPILIKGSRGKVIVMPCR